MTRFLYDMHKTAPDADRGRWFPSKPQEPTRARVQCCSCFATYLPHLISEFGECVDCI